MMWVFGFYWPSNFYLDNTVPLHPRLLRLAEIRFETVKQMVMRRVSDSDASGDTEGLRWCC